MRQANSDKPSQTGPAQRIREARERQGLTQAALAAQLGVARPMIAQWETGGRHPWISTLKRLAEALEVSYGWLAFGEESAPSQSEAAVLDPELLSAVQGVVADVFTERGLDTGEMFFFQIVAAVYAVAHTLREDGLAPIDSSFRVHLRDSVLVAIGA